MFYNKTYKAISLSFVASFFIACGGGGGGGSSSSSNDTAKTDPLLKYQWNIKNEGVIVNSSNVKTTAGNDLNIEPIWDSYTGKSIKVQVVDDGVQMNHNDLKDNIDSQNAYAYATGDTNANPAKTSDTHGTKVAGVIGAVGWNGIGLRGIAPNVTMVPFRLTSQGDSLLINQSVLDKAWVTAHDANNIAVSSNSWGACWAQDTLYDDILSSSAARAQRDNKGRIYAVAAGNDRMKNGCSANLSRMKNNAYIITVAALTHKDEYSYYSQAGANILVSAYGGGLDNIEPTIPTTTLKESNPSETFDEDEIKEYSTFNGTSAATPMVSAGIALTLEACPNLKYEDIQYLIAKTATKIHSDDKEEQVMICKNIAGCDLTNTSENVNWKALYKNEHNKWGYAIGSYFIELDLNNKESDLSKTTLAYNKFMILPSKKSDFIVGSNQSPKTQIDSLLASKSKSNMWTTTASGLNYNENYGFGKINVSAMINMCKNGQASLGAEQTYNSGLISVNETNYNITKTINMPNNFKARWIGLTFDGILPYVAEPQVFLTSPSGTKIRLYNHLSRTNENIDASLRFGSFAFMDESVQGAWELNIKGETQSTLRSYKLEIKGYN